MNAIQKIQEAGESMNVDNNFPQTLVVTEKEYAFLNLLYLVRRLVQGLLSIYLLNKG